MITTTAQGKSTMLAAKSFISMLFVAAIMMFSWALANRSKRKVESLDDPVVVGNLEDEGEAGELLSRVWRARLTIFLDGVLRRVP
jgi:hypothetical protein